MDAVDRELLEALDMPDEGLRAWFHDLRRFALAHGGERYYGELLALVEECERALPAEDPCA